MPLTITEKQMRAEEREFKRVERMIEKRDKKAMAKWVRRFTGEEKRELKRFNKATRQLGLKFYD